MGLFVCSKCGCIENTASSNYYLRKGGAPALCSLCDPDIGKWHGLFPRKKYEPSKEAQMNSRERFEVEYGLEYPTEE